MSAVEPDDAGGMNVRRTSPASERRRLTVRMMSGFHCDRAFLTTYDELLQSVGTNAAGDFLRRCILAGHSELIRGWQSQPDAIGLLHAAQDRDALGERNLQHVPTHVAAQDKVCRAAEDAPADGEHDPMPDTQSADNGLSSNNESSPRHDAESNEQGQAVAHSSSTSAAPGGVGLGQRLVTGLLGQGNTR